MKKTDDSESIDGLVGQAMSGIVEEATRERASEDQEAERQRQRQRRSALLATTLVPLAVLLTVLNLSGLGVVSWLSGAAEMSAQEAHRAALQILSDAVDELSWNFEDTGRYPQRPDFLPPEAGDDEPFSYQLRDGGRYTLSVTIDGQTATFDSNDDADAVFREVRREN